MEAAVAPASQHKRQTSVRWPFVLTALLLAILTLWRMYSGSLAQRNLADLRAFVTYDARTMLRAATAKEIRVSRLNRDKLQRLLDELVRPRMAEVEVVGDYRVEVLNDPPTQGVAQVTLRLPSGATITEYRTLFVTEDGPKHSVLRNLLFSSWRLQAIKDYGPALTNADLLQSRLDSLQRDRTLLSSLDIPGFMDGAAGLVTWDTLERETRLELLKLRAK